ncbi:hypothetical protein DRP43_01040 [candidate division TA06 bacterium]|uniref:FlgD Ig-like domain-containing protein n=1 Tax=candidate division TA06 bacterium TaxID=2250710 RepID=A0A660SNE6_UNCT6|nr:MAG: hypothetical protein DRP43_01040 [candidate division TA06 bacterium]
MSKMKIFIFIFILNLIGIHMVADTLFPDCLGDSLIDSLIAHYKPSYTLGYNAGRDTLYGVIDNHNDSLECIYAGYKIWMKPGFDPTHWAWDSNGVNCEHTWPKSLGAGYGLAKSDLHHLYASDGGVNAARGNYPFNDIIDSETDMWFRLKDTVYSIPTSNISEYSEFDYAGYFEPREIVKGNIARGMFYFYTMYKTAFLDTTGGDSSFYMVQREDLKQWHRSDPPDADEITRTWVIAGYQDNCPNPFVIDTSLVTRAYFPEELGIKECNKTYNEFRLNKISPNPFDKNISIGFEISKTVNVEICIYSITGRHIKTLINENLKRGTYLICWNGNDINGERMKRGVYLYSASINGIIADTRRIILIE